MRPLQDRRQPLIDQKRDHNAQYSFHKGKGHVKHDQAFQNIVHSGEDQLIRRQNGFFRHEVIVNGIYQEVIGEYAEDPHDQSPCNGTDQSAGAVLFEFVNQSRNKYEGCPQNKVAQFSDAACAGYEKMDKIFDQADDDACNGTVGKGADQSGKLG